MTTYMTTFIVIKDICDYHDYSASQKPLVVFVVIVTNAIVIGHSHNRPCLLGLQSDACMCVCVCV
jgi:hypothetical protein